MGLVLHEEVRVPFPTTRRLRPPLRALDPRGLWLYSHSDSYRRKGLVKILEAARSNNVKGIKGKLKDLVSHRQAETMNRKKQKSSCASTSEFDDPATHPWSTRTDIVYTVIEEPHKQIVKRVTAVEGQGKKSKELPGRCSPAQKLVEVTLRHRRYKKYYTFPSCTQGWVMTEQIEGNDSAGPEKMLSIQCKMVLCEGGQKEVVRVSIVNSDCKVMLDMLVKPRKLVVDHLTPITGVSEANLENVASNIVDAQEAVLGLLTSSTILVGHCLYHDLRALKIDHLRVIDTSFIFQYQNKTDSYNAGLNNLCKAVLGYEFRNDGVVPDCLTGAMIPMCIVLHVLEHQPKTRIVVQETELDNRRLHKLYFHRIPQTVSVEDLKKLIPKKFGCDIREICRPKTRFGNIYMVFKSCDDANKAFDMLKGPLGQDSYGRPQKALSVAVSSKDGNISEASLKVRKMLCSPSKRTRNNISIQVSWGNEPEKAKRMKLIDQKDDHCSHLEELESLRRQLTEKIAELQTLQKVVLDLEG